MKKIFTLLLAVGLVSMSFAQFPARQRGYENGNDVADNRGRNDDKRFNGHTSYHKKQMLRQIEAINEVYDRRIENVKSNWYMKRYRKQRLINELENKRREEIKCVYEKFNDRRHDDRGPKKW